MPVIINNNRQEQIPYKLITLLSSGQGLFETILYEDEILWFWELHQARLYNSLSFLNIDRPDFNLKSFVLQSINPESKKESLRIKLICLFPFDTPPQAVDRSDFLIQISPADKPQTSAKPLSLKTMPTPLSAKNPLTGHKTLAYTYVMYSRKQAIDSGFDDVLFYNEKELVSETSFANIFAVKGNQLFTPKYSAGILPGTIRSLLVQELEAREIDIPRNMIHNYDYFFVTSSIKGLRPVGKIDQVQFKIDDQKFKLLGSKFNMIRAAYIKTTKYL